MQFLLCRKVRQLSAIKYAKQALKIFLLFATISRATVAVASG